MHSDLKQISSIDALFDLSKNTSSITYRGMDVSLEWLDEYKSDLTTYRSQYAILNNNILLILSSGIPIQKDINKAFDYLEKIHDEKGRNDFNVVWDTRNFEKPNLKIRRTIIQGNKQLSKYWENYFLIIDPRYKTIIRVLKYLYRDTVQNLYFSSSIEEALNNILFKTPIPQGNDFSSEIAALNHEDLLKKSKGELVGIIERFKEQHNQTTNKVLEAIGQISWEGQFKKVDIEVKENELYFDIINAFSLLQHDIEEIIKEYKDLNQNLEFKVAERIVDYIDKESNLRAILDNSDRVTWLMNNRYELIDFNLAFSNEIKRRYNIKPKINQSVLEIIKDDREQLVWMDRFESAMKGKPGIYLDQDNYDGTDHVLEIKTFPIKEIGKIKGVSVFVEDITELKDSQFKLIEKNRDLEKVNTELDSFVYRVSHDLRAPLTSILGLINLIKLETNMDKISEYMTLQERSIHKLDLFIKEIINLSRNARLGITASKIDFNELLNEIFESQNYTTSTEKVRRIYNIDNDLSFYTDRQRLSIILNNLISNSLKYVDTHKDDPYVSVNVQSDNGNCIIEVADNGIGISEIFLPKIFEMFYRATKEFTGSGLGLYIVKETVEKLKGKVTVKSKTRQGSTFKVVLPNLKDRFDAAPKLED